ncbi:flagellar assembly protein FliX [Hyphobacterium marinum]|uniref:Flagellar assembly protein FliX n=1 Tax=Hyphobacterium marinum TaxID=3116574 RepID=A0ABU7LZS5_9PROT|nr:flagellar assembly protein FliX [Hyphobacterium sp. Y6023]MEE2567048.1 flagellar assembly protein FliX [Hyphobacterium sp. Y6023]
MKVTGPRSTQSTQSARRKPGAGGGADGFSVGSASGQRAAAPAAGTSGASGVSSVDAILALQSVGDFKEAKKQATGRALSMLDVLDDLKLALLEGGIPQSRLVALMDLLRSRREATNEPGLEAALDEVEVRAAVELAKLRA